MEKSKLIAGTVLVVAIAGIAAGVLYWPQGPQPTPDVEPVAVAPAPDQPVEPEPRTAVAPDKPNVLFILWDTVRADHLSLYGYERPTTPRLAAFAENAVVYERATSAAMWTLPAHAAMFTGLATTTHGAHAGNRWLDEHHTTLSEHLGVHGYDTLGMTTNIIAGKHTNLSQGFDTWEATYDNDSKLRKPARRAMTAKLIQKDRSTEVSPAFASKDPNLGWSKAMFKDAAPVLHKGLVDWITARDDQTKPFFAYINMMEAHTPRVPSMKARRRMMDDPELIKLGLETDQTLFTEVAYMAGARDYSDREIEAIRGIYDATLLELDVATDRLLKDLEARGILEHTIVIITADHGEGLGEHRRMEHRYSMYQQLLHVPLVVYYPERLKGERVSEPVSTLDLFATILDLAEVPPPDHEVQARSLVGRDAGTPVFSQMLDPWAETMTKVRNTYPDLDYEPLLKTYSAVFHGDHKLLKASDGQHELYDVVSDPAESKNLYQTSAELAADLLGRLNAYEAALPPYDPSQRGEGEGPKAASTDEKAMLEMLGYVDEG